MHCVDLATGIYKGQSKPLHTSMTIATAEVFLIIMAVMAVAAIKTVVAIVTFMTIVTVLVVQTVIQFSGITPGIKCKELVAR